MSTLPAGNYQPASMTFLDAGNETGAFRVWGALITAANHDTQVTLWDAVVTNAQNFAVGTLIRNYYAEKTTYVRTPPTNGAAREIALQVIMINPSSGVDYRFNIPTLDPSLITYVANVGAKDAVDPTTTNLPELTTALEAFCVDPRAPAVGLTVQGYRVVRGLK